jgi:hypothetical protein
VGTFYIVVLFAVTQAAAGATWSDMEQVWRRPVASSVALVMLHLAMRSISLQCIWVATKIAHDKGSFIRHHHHFGLTNCSQIT